MANQRMPRDYGYDSGEQLEHLQLLAHLSQYLQSMCLRNPETNTFFCMMYMIKCF